MKKYIITLMLLLIGRHGAYAQEFVNLDFESANVSGYSLGLVPATDAIPGWTAYISGVAQTSISYNMPMGMPAITLFSTNSSSGLHGFHLQDQYFLEFGAYYVRPEINTVAIGQTGQIPVGTQSLTFIGYLENNVLVTFNGSPISFSAIDSAPDYTVYGADISEYAGDTGQLLFTATLDGTIPVENIDDIQFSPSPVSEPGVLSLLGMGGIFLSGTFYRRCANRRC